MTYFGVTFEGMSLSHPLCDPAKLFEDLISIHEDNARRWNDIAEGDEISTVEARYGGRKRNRLDASGREEFTHDLRSGQIVRIEACRQHSSTVAVRLGQGNVFRALTAITYVIRG